MKRTYGYKVYVNFRGLNLPEDDTQCEFFTVISIDDLFEYFTIIKFIKYQSKILKLQERF